MRWTRLLIPALFLVTGCIRQEKTAVPSTPNESQTPAASKATTPESSAAPANQLDLTYITGDYTSAVVMHPSRLIESPLVNSLQEAGVPVDDAIATLKQQMGFDPHNVSEMILLFDARTTPYAPQMLMARPTGFTASPSVIDSELTPITPPDSPERPLPPDDDSPSDRTGKEPQQRSNQEHGSDSALLLLNSDGLQPVNTQLQELESTPFAEITVTSDTPPLPTAIMRFVEPFDRQEFLARATTLEEKEVDGLKVYANLELAFYFVDDKTLIAAPEQNLKLMLSTKQVESSLTRRLRGMDANHDLIVSADLSGFASDLSRLSGLFNLMAPPELAGLATVPTQLRAISFGCGLSGKNLLDLHLDLDSGDSASQANEQLAKFLEQQRLQSDQSQEQIADRLPIQSPEAKQKIISIIHGMITGASSSATGMTLNLSIPQPQDLPELVALLKPDIDKAKADAERKKNLTEIGRAFQSFGSSFTVLPSEDDPDSKPKDRQPLLSWRVHLLNDLGEFALYGQFHLDEPWDSEHNKTLIDKMPEVFLTPGVNEKGKTSLHVFVGKQSFEPGQSLLLKSIADGKSKTIFIVEAGPDKAEIWTKPGGLNAAAEDPRSELGTITQDTFLALFGDGNVRAIKLDISLETLKALLTHDGGEVIDFDSF